MIHPKSMLNCGGLHYLFQGSVGWPVLWADATLVESWVSQPSKAMELPMIFRYLTTQPIAKEGMPGLQVPSIVI